MIIKAFEKRDLLSITMKSIEHGVFQGPYTQSVMMSDLSNAVAPRLGFLHAPLNSLLGQQA